MASFSTAERMALAVLNGDMDQAGQLADLILELGHGGAKKLPAVSVVSGQHSRAAIFLNKDFDIQSERLREQLTECVERWLDGERRIVAFTGVDRIEVYQFAPDLLPAPEDDEPIGSLFDTEEPADG